MAELFANERKCQEKGLLFKAIFGGALGAAKTVKKQKTIAKKAP